MPSSRLRLVFMGTPDFAVPVLRALIGAGHDMAAVYTRAPKPAGRGRELKKSPVHLLAESKGIPVRTPKSLKSEDEQKAFRDLGAGLGVVAAYGLILPKAVLEAPHLGCINVHASLLPRWRGAAPIHRALLAGDEETGICLMQMDEGLDTGPVLLREAMPITPATTAQSLHDDLSRMGARLAVAGAKGVLEGSLTPVPQPAEGATYAERLRREEGQVSWDEDAAILERKARGLNPWPGLFFEMRGTRIKILEAEVVARDGKPGTLLDNSFTIACGKGALRLPRVQREGRAPMEGAAFLRGFAVKVGEKIC